VNDPFDLDDSEFDEVEFQQIGSKQTNFAIGISTVSLRGIHKFSINFSEEAIAKLDGWPRFTVSYNAKNWMFRIRAAKGGPYHAFELTSGKKSIQKRFILRVPMQLDTKHIPKVREAAPHKYSDDGKTVNIQIPPVFRIDRTKLQLGEKLTQQRLKELVPAPNYSTKKDKQ
jgi:hypothetical protein